MKKDWKDPLDLSMERRVRVDVLSDTIRETDQSRMFTIDEEIFHGMIGLATDACELLDIAKKKIFYDKAFDLVNLYEELGDCMWFIGLIVKRMAELTNTSEVNVWNTIINSNREKLRRRYPNGYTSANAIVRDTSKERAAIANELPTLVSTPGDRTTGEQNSPRNRRSRKSGNRAGKSS